MGGYGSGRWRSHTKKPTVEECWVLSLDKLLRDDMILRSGRSGSVTWSNNFTQQVVASVGYCIEQHYDDQLVFRLQYTVGRGGDRHNVDEPVLLQKSHPSFGGVRWWFTCPLLSNGRPCWRRVSKLYLPPGGRYYGCRHCYELTYTSCQESHKYDSMFDSLARSMRDRYPKMTGRDVKELLKWAAKR